MAVLERVRVFLWMRNAEAQESARQVLSDAGFEVVILSQPLDLVVTSSRFNNESGVLVLGTEQGWREILDQVEERVAVVHVVHGSEIERISTVLQQGHAECVIHPWHGEQLVVSVQAAWLKHQHRLARPAMGDENQYSSWKGDQWVDALGIGMLGTDMTGRIRAVNAIALQWLGYESKNELLGQSLIEAYRVYEPAIGIDKLAPSFVAAKWGHASNGRLVRLRLRNGSFLMVEDRGMFLKDESGGVQGMVVTFMPVVVQPPIESGKGLATTGMDWSEAVTDPLVMVDENWLLVKANAAAERWLGKKALELVGQHWWDLFPPSLKELHGTGFAEASKRRESHHVELYLESSGAWYETRSYPLPQGRLLWLKDITTRKLEWERGHRMDRLESLGLLARGFAHDFNNLLTVLLGNLALAEQQSETVGQNVALREIKAARQATALAQGLVQQLLTFARGGAPVKRSISMKELVGQFFEQHPQLAGIKYVLDLKEEWPVMSVDPHQIRRLLGNLVRNAEQSMPNGGKLLIRGEVADAERLYGHDVLQDTPTSPAGILLEVVDEGEGIAAKHLPHIFEPYFTTRTQMNATGLGLTVCESIARAHGGAINVYTGENGKKGTRVCLFLPCEEEELGSFNHGHEHDSPVLTSRINPKVKTGERSHPAEGMNVARPARILVLEDDHLVRMLIARGLQSQGYEVVETVDGQETVRLYETAMKERRPFDVVILDLSIPNGMGGVRTMEMLRGLDPQVQALVSSGYSDDPAMSQPSLYGFAAVLPKPYEPADLIKTVKRLLEQRMKSNSGK